jgi:hypothetical protein
MRMASVVVSLPCAFRTCMSSEKRKVKSQTNHSTSLFSFAFSSAAFILVVEECDATGDAMKTIVGFTKIIVPVFLLPPLLNEASAR